ncbi:MAG: guanylate kinase [Deltaproteobacteria bacterium]|nr:guanylate kinase [Deltaproteobacteria bacterium]
MSRQGHLFIVSAPSGTGKTTLCNAILQARSDLEYSISYTTRSPRKGEQEGVAYHFIPKDVFREKIKSNEWAEWAEVHGNFYGTSAEVLKKTLNSGKDVLLDIDTQGAKKLRSRYPDATLIFIMPPSFKELEKRLCQRGTDPAESIARRLEDAKQEMKEANFYDVVITNGDLSVAIAELKQVIEEIRTA